MPKLLLISGSLRAGSYNRKLLEEAARLFGEAEVVRADLRLPLYDGDLEDAEGIPAQVQALADQVAAADAVVISTPEYNKNLSGVLKNALDWVSRTKGGPWRGKPVAIVSATGGRAGGERAQNSLRLCLNPFRPHVLPGPEVLVGQCEEQFDAQGRLTNVRYEKALTELMSDLRALSALAKAA
ncbi:NADPH-dependent FMN reductase [Pseudoruegeria sp. SHC-113]|uniref:NADPH-dependent FMN reductase n=1 Tax=Pseudoruegeria sp. SHC-113 TaxID=2855439 RepID=UPI0021BB3B57|nr:NAD(P)H-dependent oxidoreductase [Pseudoruegeria sp. SHC-113]MCT8159186.1 NAD(P)H-dependent oxidoreductase [Pseudoruegeria sp. SHC-113]